MTPIRRPTYMDPSPTDVETPIRCKRCNALVGLDVNSRRLELRCEQGKTVAISTKPYGGRCANCYEFVEWYPSKRK